MSRLTRTALGLVGVLALASCTTADPRRAVAEQFIERLFVVIDQAKARELTVGLATTKIDEEIRLTAGQAIDETTRQPHVGYRLLQVAGDPGDPTSSLVYELRVTPEDADAFTRQLLLTLRRDEGAWRVANYTLESPPSG